MSAIHTVTMPKWGLSMTQGKVVEWLVDEGSEISPGTELLEVETEKIVSAVEATVPGVLRRKVARPEDVVAVAGLLGVVADPSVSDSDIESFITEFRGQAAAQDLQPDAPRIAPETVVSAGQSLRYLRRGEGQPCAILIHGFGGDLNGWLFNHEELAARRTVYALDLPGHGGSSKQVGSGTVEELAATLERFIDAVGARPAHLVGHSMGGVVALDFALKHPDQVLSLTLIAPAGLGTEIDREYIDGFITATRRKTLTPHIEKLFADSKLAGRQMVEDILAYKRLDGVEAALRTLAGQFCPDGRQAVVLREEVGRLSQPVLVIWGSEDRIIPASHGRDLPANVRTDVLAGRGHMVHMEAAAKVNRLIQSFWDERVSKRN
jgi:pyruvate dehydrogenase E2 component (dihydrolipoamide acetyltransferase)